MNSSRIPPKKSERKPPEEPVEKRQRVQQDQGIPRVSAARAKQPSSIPSTVLEERNVTTEVTAPSAQELKDSLEQAMKLAKKDNPDIEHPNFDELFTALKNKSPEYQHDFIKKIDKLMQPPGWPMWLLQGGPLPGLLDRTCALYNRGISVASGMLSELQSRVIEPVSKIVEPITSHLDPLVRQAGVWAHEGVSYIMPPVAEFLAKIFTLPPILYADFDPYESYDEFKAEGVAKKTQEVIDQTSNKIAAIYLSDRKCADLTEYMNRYKKKYSVYVSKDIAKILISLYYPIISPRALGSFLRSPDIAGLRDSLIEMTLTIALMEEFGMLSRFQISVLVYCIMTMIKSGDVPLGTAAFKVLLKGPLSFMNVAKKRGLKAMMTGLLMQVPPALAPAVKYVVGKILTKEVFVPIFKKPIKTKLQQKLDFSAVATPSFASSEMVKLLSGSPEGLHKLSSEEIKKFVEQFNKFLPHERDYLRRLALTPEKMLGLPKEISDALFNPEELSNEDLNRFLNQPPGEKQKMLFKFLRTLDFEKKRTVHRRIPKHLDLGLLSGIFDALRVKKK